jgi:hypothetical protein
LAVGLGDGGYLGEFGPVIAMIIALAMVGVYQLAHGKDKHDR